MVQLKEVGLVCDGVSLCCVSFFPRVASGGASA